MPRGPRLDAPGVLQHVMARGIEQRLLFRDDHDRQDFLDRLGTLVGGQWPAPSSPKENTMGLFLFDRLKSHDDEPGDC
jgi:hypothetical protein